MRGWASPHHSPPVSSCQTSSQEERRPSRSTPTRLHAPSLVGRVAQAVNPQKEHSMELAPELKPVSLIGFGDGTQGAPFTGMNPATGMPLEPRFFSATAEDLQRAAVLAQSAFPIYSNLSGKRKGAFLRSIAASVEAAAATIIQRAHLETALPQARLAGELERT